MFDVGIEAVTCFGSIVHYGAVWLVEMRDWASLIVIEAVDRDEDNFILKAGQVVDDAQDPTMIARYTDSVRTREEELRYATELLFGHLARVREGTAVEIDRLIHLAAGLKRCAQNAGEALKAQRREGRKGAKREIVPTEAASPSGLRTATHRGECK